MDLEKIPFSVKSLSESLYQMFKVRFEEKGIEFANSCDISNREWVLGDPNRIRQVLINLVINALKFTESGQVSVRMSVAQGRGNFLVVDVEDSGVGIPADAQFNLFQQFVQADSTTTRKHGSGFGLGLAISDKLVGLMGGTIFFASEEGKGTRFQVKIPAEPAKREEIPESSELARSLSGRICILGRSCHSWSCR